MLNLTYTKHERALELPLYSLSSAIVQGAGLVYTPEAGEQRVKLSAGGSNNDVFAGFALTSYVKPTQKVEVEAIAVADGATTFDISYTPLTPSTQMLVKNAAGTVLAYHTGGSPSNAQFDISGTTLTIHADNDNQTITVTYLRSLTAAESERMFGDGSYIGSQQPSLVTGTIGVIMGGTIFTDQFVVSDDWAAFTNASTLKVTANGLITMASATGATVRGTPIQAPTAEVPFLGIRFWVT